MHENPKIENIDSLLLDYDNYMHFNCGVALLNQALIKRLEPKNEDSNKSDRMLVVRKDDKIVAFMTYGFDKVRLDRKSKEKNYIPVLKIGNVAVDLNNKGRGYGTYLISFAFRVLNTVSPFVEVRGIFLEALEEAVPFYTNILGFENIQIDKYNHFLNSFMPDDVNKPRLYQMYINSSQVFVNSEVFPPIDYTYEYY